MFRKYFDNHNFVLTFIFVVLEIIKQLCLSVESFDDNEPPPPEEIELQEMTFDNEPLPEIDLSCYEIGNMDWKVFSSNPSIIQQFTSKEVTINPLIIADLQTILIEN